MQQNEWMKSFSGSITVCDPDGVILEMNEQAARDFETSGGMDLIGKNMLVCHPERVHSRIRQLLNERKSNVYTVEKQGIKKFVYQAPWYREGEYAGFVELILPIPSEVPHFIRDKQQEGKASAA